MAKIDFNDVGHCYSGNPERVEDFALQPMTHSWENGRAYALLGPSGCGKTTLLNIISGLIRPSQGRVLFGGVDVTDWSTAKRNIAQVFQFPVIYKYATVYDNLAFPLRCRKFPAAEIDRKVREVAELLKLTGQLKSPAAKLSAGAKQLTSLGRGLVRNDVAALLLDEPLTVIDPHLKWLLRRKLKEVNETYNQTMILVTHDQNEALTFAEQVVVMQAGQIVQVGTAQELFEKPRHTFIGYFIGSPSMNFMRCRLEGGAVEVGGETIPLPELAEIDVPPNRKLEIGIRPEFLELKHEASSDTLEVPILNVKDLGNFRIATVRFAGHDLKIKIPEARSIPSGKGFLRFPPQWTKLYVDDVLREPVGR